MTPDRFILNQVEYLTEIYAGTDSEPCRVCCATTQNECFSLPPCDPVSNHGQSLYFKQAERNDDLNFGEGNESAGGL